MTEQNQPEHQQPSTSLPASESLSTSGLAVAGLVLGILAAATAFLPIINNVSFFIALVGLILSVVGLVGINKGKHSGKGIAIAGMVLGIASLVIVLLMQAACSAMLSGASSHSSNSAGGSQAAEQAGQADPTQSSYEVTIDDAVVTSDYEGNPAIIVTFSWKNNSDDATSFAGALYPKCYQNGVQLDTAIVLDGIDSSSYTADVKPGSGTTVQMAYELTDESPVEVEVSELISLNDTILASKTFEVA